MANFYPKQDAKSKPKSEKLSPKPETISFILNYSKALKVINLKNSQHDTFLN